MKTWLPVVLNALLVVAGIVVHLTPNTTDDEIYDKVKVLLPTLLASLNSEQGNQV